MNNKETIEKLIEKNQKISDRNYMNYQQSGESRYLRAHEKAEDIIDVCRLALGASDDHQMVGALKSYISAWGSDAVSLLHQGGPDSEVASLLKNIRDVALIYGLTTDPWRDEG